jgi:molybdate transport system substrate-binding protein
MTCRLVRRVWLLTLLCAFVLCAQKAPLHVLASNGMKGVILDLQPQIEKAAGRALDLQFSTTTAIIQKVDAGVDFDVAILASDGLDDLIHRSKLAADSRADFARSGIGLAVKAGAPKPDISNAAALKKTLQKAPSIAYAKDGQSAPFVVEMFQKLGLTNEVKPKLLLTAGSGPAMQSVAEGKTAVVLTLMSELLTVKGIDPVGLFPPDFQHWVPFGAAVNPKSKAGADAKAMLAFLKSSAAAPVYQAKGMEPLSR